MRGAEHKWQSAQDTVIMLIVTFLIIILSGFMLNVVMLSVVVPLYEDTIVWIDILAKEEKNNEKNL